MSESAARRAIVVLSYSAGQESWTLACLAANDPEFREKYVGDKELILVMSGTGAEHRETDQHREYTEKDFAPRHGLQMFHVTPAMGYHTGAWAKGLIGQFEANATITSMAFPYASCTHSLKIAPLYAFLNDYIGDRFGYANRKNKGAIKAYAREFGKLVVWIGFSKGEERRVADAEGITQRHFAFVQEKRPTRPLWFRDSVTVQYPLIDVGFDRVACQQYVRKIGERPCPPSLCWPCHWKSDQEVLLLRMEDPDRFEKWVALEQRKLDTWGDEAFRRKKQKRFTPNGVFRNLPVGGQLTPEGKPITLSMRADAMREKLCFLDDAGVLAYLQEFRQTHGHPVGSRY